MCVGVGWGGGSVVCVRPSSCIESCWLSLWWGGMALTQGVVVVVVVRKKTKKKRKVVDGLEWIGMDWKAIDSYS